LRTSVLAIAILCCLPLAAQNRMATDFEMQQMERQLAQKRDFRSQLAGRLNLGDLRIARNEPALARAEYAKALELAQKDRLDARKDSSFTRYASDTAYAGFAAAKLGDRAQAFALLEEALRYTSDDPKTWNLYAGAMALLRESRKAVSAARNAVYIGGEPLDLAVYRYTLASALLDVNERSEAETLLAKIVSDLRSPAFDDLKKSIAKKEAFEIYSTASGDESTYLSLLNRAQLRLGALHETRGDVAKARATFRTVLDARSDDAMALAAMARLSAGEERERYYAEAFAANPFSTTLIAQYRKETHPADAKTRGVQLALDQMARGEYRAAQTTLDALLAKFPHNDVLRSLRREVETARNDASNELRRVMTSWERLSPDERVALDQRTFTAVAAFQATHANGQTVIEAGTVDGVPFRFSEPTAFNGTFTDRARLAFHILGVTQQNGADALLLEPLKLEALP